MKMLVLAAMLGCAAAAGTAMAQEGPEHGGPGAGRGMGLMRADANGDGVVTRAEFQADVDARFARMDADGNGVLKGDELRGGRGGHRRPDMPPPPRDGAGEGPPPGPVPPVPTTMTRDQFRARAMARFDRMDADHDGRVDRPELSAAFRNRVRGDAPPPPAD